jgi:hypothetical protein
MGAKVGHSLRRRLRLLKVRRKLEAEGKWPVKK